MSNVPNSLFGDKCCFLRYCNAVAIAKPGFSNASCRTPHWGHHRGSMYGVVGTSTEVTLLATEFLPPQVAFAAAHGILTSP